MTDPDADLPVPLPLRVQALSVGFAGRAVLDGLDVTARRGEITAVLGPNGAGKTTLVRCCTGLVRPDGGRISVLGGPPGDRRSSARVGLMPQSTGAWSGIRAGELLRYLAGLYATPQDLGLLVAELRLEPLLRTPYRRLSGGQQQAVNLAAALVGRPELVFLDEPTAGMDPHARRATWSLLERLRSAGVTVVLTTHAMEEAAALADQVFILDRGRVAVAGTVAELTRDGQSLEDVFLAHTSLPAGA
ncbi:ABC transporter ATP-binding protein [Friedmanniella luteola]|uniref:ABC transporter ATP-binding protein n=1 Tax=Friedmanniella luteola TaxID=546871 RepID=UPI003CC9FAB7